MKKFLLILFTLIFSLNAQSRTNWELLRYDIFESTCKQLMPQGYEVFYLDDDEPKKHFVLTESQKRWTQSEENDFFRTKTFIVNHADKEIYVIKSLIRRPDNISTAVKAGQEKAQRDYHEKMKKTVDAKVNDAKAELRRYLGTLPVYSANDPEIKDKVYALFQQTVDKVVQIVKAEKARQRAANDVWPQKYIDEYENSVTAEVNKVNLAIAKKYGLEDEFEL